MALRYPTVWCVLVALGCGGGTPDAAEPVSATHGEASVPAPPAPLSLLPADTFAVLRVDLEALRASPYYPTLTGWLDDAQASAEEAGQPLHNLQLLRATLEQSSVVVVGMVPGRDGGPPEPVVVARGRFEEAELPRFLERASSSHGPVRSEQRNGFTVHVGGEGEGAQLDDHTWLLAVPPHVDAMLGRYASGGGPIASDALREMAERVEMRAATAAFAMEVLPDVRTQMARRLVGPARGVEEARRLGGRLELSDGLHLRVLADMQDPQTAEALAGRARDFLAQAGDHMVVRMMGVGAVFDHTTLGTEGATAVLETRLDDATTRHLLDRIGSFVRLALQAAAQEMSGTIRVEPPPPAPPPAEGTP